MAGVVGVLAVVLAHAEQPPWASHHRSGHAEEGTRWGLRAQAEAFYVPGGYRLVGGEMREPQRASAAYSNGPQQRGGSIRDAVTRYSEERGGSVEQPRGPRGNGPPPGSQQDRHH